MQKLHKQLCVVVKVLYICLTQVDQADCMLAARSFVSQNELDEGRTVEFPPYWRYSSSLDSTERFSRICLQGAIQVCWYPTSEPMNSKLWLFALSCRYNFMTVYPVNSPESLPNIACKPLLV